MSTDLAYFKLINPCGLNRPVTSMKQLMGDKTPSMDVVRNELAKRIQAAFSK